MSINIKSLVADRSKNIKFEAIGDFGEGRVTIAELVDDPNDATKPKFPVFTLTDEDDVDRKLWGRSAQMLEAIAEACEKSGSDGIEIGDWLKVSYVDEKVLRSGRTMKIYAAEHTPAVGF